jgi:signal transduction histidine kinase
MQYRRRLRSRIILSFALLGTGLTASFALATVFLRAHLENQLIGEALEKNLEDYAGSFYRSPDIEGVPFEQITGLVVSKRRFANAPLAWRDLDSGLHDLVERDESGKLVVYKLAVRKDADYWFFLKYDTSQTKRSQQQLVYALVGAVLVFSLLSLLLGYWSSRRVIRPVAELARRVRAFRGSDQPEPLAQWFANDEVGELAAALDDYAAQLTQVVRRDREFNADVSHELRTPLAVIRGATELLMVSPQLSDKMCQRLQRIERAEQQCTHLISALLMLSRNERGTGHTDVRKLAEVLVDANRLQMLGKPVELRVVGDEGHIVNVPEAVLSVALGNLLGNACKYTVQGEVVVRVESGRVSIEDTGPGLSAEDAANLFERGYRGTSAGATKGAGIGLSIVRRLCDLYQWQVRVEPRSDRIGAVAILDFNTGKPAASS